MEQEWTPSLKRLPSSVGGRGALSPGDGGGACHVFLCLSHIVVCFWFVFVLCLLCFCLFALFFVELLFCCLVFVYFLLFCLVFIRFLFSFCSVLVQFSIFCLVFVAFLFPFLLLCFCLIIGEQCGPHLYGATKLTQEDHATGVCVCGQFSSGRRLFFLAKMKMKESKN